MKKSIILVPTDFTEVANTAIEHGVTIAKSVNGEVVILHVIGDQSEADQAKIKVNELAQKIATEKEVETKGIIRIGNIFDDIGDAASELDAMIIIMGTHGVKGIQHLTGSHAMKVITHSVVPFIVVQDKGPQGGYSNIVVPLDLSKETKQKLHMAAEIAEYFSSKIHLFVPNEDDEYLVNQLKRNIQFAKDFLDDRGVECTTNVSEGDTGSFAKEVIAFAKEKNADLISIMNLGGNSLLGILGSSYEQQMITNEEQIPVMCVNPREVSSTAGQGLFS